ncbi:MAG: 50S ribosomal protein L24 [Candidatus Omnitrophica bacterium]|nr:50S ribosomal protein L24 [Candidatus Omnitrophota bacterium]
MASAKIKKGDLVYVRKGKDRGKKGKVLAVFPKEKKALVEGINLVKKHMRARSETQPGGILSIPAPLSISNLMLICPRCAQPTRVGFKITSDKKMRLCKKCKEVF